MVIIPAITVLKGRMGMKNLDKVFLIAGVVSLALLAIITSCDYNLKFNGAKITKEDILVKLSRHRWRVAAISEPDGLKLVKLKLEFRGDGYVNAAQENSIINGTWTVFHSTHEKLKLNLDLGDKLEILNDDWTVVETSDEKIILEEHNRNIKGGIVKITLERV
jgi:hypothetical protein